MLRSLVAPLYLIVSVGLSYLAALGVSTIVFIDIGGSDGLTFILPFLMFIFLLALGEDYNILVMTRIHEEAHSMPLRDAVVKAVGLTGPTVTSAGLVLAGTFGVLAVAGGGGPSGGQVRDIGVGLAVGISHGHLPCPHLARPVDGRSPRTVELVAGPVSDVPMVVSRR